MMKDDVRDRLHTELEEVQLRFHRLLESLTESDWDAPSCNPAWTNGQLLFHMAFAFILIPPLFSMIRFWSRRSRRSSHAFAQTLDSATPLFNRINALGPRVGARVYGRRRLGAKYDSVHIAIMRRLDSVRDFEWDRGMYYPRRWDPSFGEFMTFEELFHYPIVHFRHHQRQMSAGARPKGVKVDCREFSRTVGGSAMRLPNSAQTSRPWRIRELTHDFRLEDVWALPTPGGPRDFHRLVERFASSDPSRGSLPGRALWAVRWKLGELLGWDGPDTGVGTRVPTLRDRMPADLRDAPCGPDFAALPFTSLYLLDDEWAAEIANKTMHGVLHLGWVPDGKCGYHGQLAVYVKPNGLLGKAYMAAIKPFRHLLVYPAMIRTIGREWRKRSARAARD